MADSKIKSKSKSTAKEGKSDAEILLPDGSTKVRTYIAKDGEELRFNQDPLNVRQQLEFFQFISGYVKSIDDVGSVLGSGLDSKGVTDLILGLAQSSPELLDDFLCIALKIRDARIKDKFIAFINEASANEFDHEEVADIITTFIVQNGKIINNFLKVQFPALKAAVTQTFKEIS